LKAETIMAATNQEVLDALIELHEALDEAYWVASDVATKDRIYGIGRAVYVEQTRLSRLAIAERGKRYKAVNVDIKRVGERLKKLQDDIDDMIQAIDTVGQVVSAVGKVLSLIGKLA